jgi:hypothetical protein
VVGSYSSWRVRIRLRFGIAPNRSRGSASGHPRERSVFSRLGPVGAQRTTFADATRRTRPANRPCQYCHRRCRRPWPLPLEAAKLRWSPRWRKPSRLSSLSRSLSSERRNTNHEFGGRLARCKGENVCASPRGRFAELDLSNSWRSKKSLHAPRGGVAWKFANFAKKM